MVHLFIIVNIDTVRNPNDLAWNIRKDVFGDRMVSKTFRQIHDQKMIMSILKVTAISEVKLQITEFYLSPVYASYSTCNI
jgi:hypothetical protein